MVAWQNRTFTITILTKSLAGILNMKTLFIPAAVNGKKRKNETLYLPATVKALS